MLKAVNPSVLVSHLGRNTNVLVANTTWAEFELEHLNTASSAMKSSGMEIDQSKKLSTSQKLEGRVGGAHHLIITTRQAAKVSRSNG